MPRPPIPSRTAPVNIVDQTQNRNNELLHRRISELENISREVMGDLDSAVSGVSSGRWLNRQFLTGTGTYVPTKGTKTSHVIMVGGGGGSGGVSSTTGAPDACSAGGNSGWVLEFRANGINDADVTGGAYSCGSAGTAGTSAPTNGGNGGDTTLIIGGRTYVAKGGTGSTAQTNFNGTPVAPATTSTSGTGIISYYGTGGPATVNASGGDAHSGTGGSCPPLGSGGYGVSPGLAIGGPGLGFGGGAGGACADFFSVQGAAGAAGAILIDEYT